MKNEIDVIKKYTGIINEIEQRRIRLIADYFNLPLHSDDDIIIVQTVGVVYDGWLSKLYAIPNVKQPEQLAYELTAMSLQIFHDTKLISNKKELEGEKNE